MWLLQQNLYVERLHLHSAMVQGLFECCFIEWVRETDDAYCQLRLMWSWQVQGLNTCILRQCNSGSDTVGLALKLYLISIISYCDSQSFWKFNQLICNSHIHALGFSLLSWNNKQTSYLVQISGKITTVMYRWFKFYSDKCTDFKYMWYVM